MQRIQFWLYQQQSNVMICFALAWLLYAVELVAL